MRLTITIPVVVRCDTDVKLLRIKPPQWLVRSMDRCSKHTNADIAQAGTSDMGIKTRGMV